RQDLVRRVEAAEHKSLVRQSAIGARRNRRGDFARRVAGKQAMRHREKTLGEKRLLVVGGGEAIGDHVVVPGRPQRAEVPEPADLYRRGPEHENFGPRMRGVTVEIDQDVDVIVADALRDRRAAFLLDAGKVVEGTTNARTQRILLGGKQAVGEALD